MSLSFHLLNLLCDVCHVSLLDTIANIHIYTGLFKAFNITIAGTLPCKIYTTGTVLTPSARKHVTVVAHVNISRIIFHHTWLFISKRDREVIYLIIQQSYDFEYGSNLQPISLLLWFCYARVMSYQLP